MLIKINVDGHKSLGRQIGKKFHMHMKYGLCELTSPEKKDFKVNVAYIGDKLIFDDGDITATVSITEIAQEIVANKNNSIMLKRLEKNKCAICDKQLWEEENEGN